MQKKFLPDYWQVNIKGISVWSYFRFDHNGLQMSKYTPNYKFSAIDILFFFKFIFLRLSKRDTIFFIAARNELLSLANNEYFNSNHPPLIFLREDGHSIKGNVFFLEALRFLFRKSSQFLFYRRCLHLRKQLTDLNLNILKLESHIKDAVGDYYFNKTIRFFLKGKTIYFSNCVIPKIERSQALHKSFELQHGVIHDEHPDYANLAINIYNVPLISWGEFWKDKIISAGFTGSVIAGPIPSYTSDNKEGINKIVFFTTIDFQISTIIIDALESLKQYDILVQPHPRDPFVYETEQLSNVKLCKGESPLNSAISIMHDSTLIYFCISNKKKFIYLANPEENTDEIEIRLAKKYNAKINEDYQVIKTTSELVLIIKQALY